MKKVVFLCLFIAGTFAISSCTSNLEQVETINLDRETVFADSAYTARFLSQIYTNVGYDVKPNRYKTEFMGWVTQHGGLQTACDEAAYKVVSDVTNDVMFATGTINPVNVKEDDVWKIAYVNIRRANVFMRYVDGSPITKSVKQQYKAEARFLRAWYYAMLLRHYGGVPLIGDNIYEVDDDMKTSRDTYADCVEYIVNECELAARDLPNKFRGINTGRATAGSCKGLISRVRLYEASKLFNGSDFGKSAGFPKELMDTFTKETGYGYLGNEVASGTEIIERLGAEHIKTGKPIVYTSADSVFQIAAHEDVIPLEELYRICQITRDKVCVGDYYVGRIIARPFVGELGSFVRTSNRHDYSRMPEKKMVPQELQDAKVPTVAVGKIGDIYAHVGWDESYPTKTNSHGMNMVPYLLGSSFERGLMMVNLVEFDSLYGHRRNVEGYKRAIEDFDYQLGGLLQLLNDDDLLLITADHGNDPTWKGTDHTRELVPILGYSPRIDGPIDLGDRKTFADIGETILENFGLKQWGIGTSFLEKLSK